MIRLLVVMAAATLLQPGAVPRTWYMVGTDMPVAQLSADRPGIETLDPDGDGVPGIVLEPAQAQEFLARHDGLVLDGRPEVGLWTRSTGPEASGELVLSLLSCEGGPCRRLSTVRVLEDPWGPEQAWERRRFVLPAVTERLPAGTLICLRIEVLGDDAVEIAYGSSEFPSALVLPVFGTDEPDDTGGGGQGEQPAPGGGGGDDVTDHDNLPSPEDRSDLLAGTGLWWADAGVRGWALVGPLAIGLAATAILAGTVGGLSTLRRRLVQA